MSSGKVLIHQPYTEEYEDRKGKPSLSLLPAVILDRIADAFAELGYDVSRWCSAFLHHKATGRVRFLEEFPVGGRFDFVVIWGGNQFFFPMIKMHLIDCGTTILYSEVDSFGWYRTQKSDDDLTFVLSRSLCPFAPTVGGVCGFHSWQRFELSSEGGEVSVGDGDLLVTLQDNMTLRQHRDVSPLFADSAGLVNHMIANSAVPIRVRAHPSYEAMDKTKEIVAAADNAVWDESPNIEAAIDGACALACIDSHCGVRAIRRNMPVLCYGMAVYRKAGVSWPCVTPYDTQRYTAMLKDRKCDLEANKQNEFVEILKGKMWKLSDLPGRLKELIDEGGI